MTRLLLTPPTTFGSLVPLSALLPSFPWPEDRVSSTDGGTALLDRIFATDWSFAPDHIDLSLYVPGEIELTMPGVDGISLVLFSGGDDELEGVAFSVRAEWDTDLNWSITFYDLVVSLRFDTDLLTPMEDAGDGTYTTGEGPYEIHLVGQVSLDSDWTFDFSGCDSVDLTPVQIGTTGVIIAAEDIIIDLSGATTPSEILALGFDADFRGVYMGECTVTLPEAWGDALHTYLQASPRPEIETDDNGEALRDADGELVPTEEAPDVYTGPRLTFSTCAIGSGGFGGDIDFDFTMAEPDLDEVDIATDADGVPKGLVAELYGFGLAIQHFQVSVRNNVITAALIDGSLQVPFFDRWLDVKVGIEGDGDFSITVAAEDEDALVNLEIDGVAIVIVDSLGIAVEDGDAALVVTGSIQPQLEIGGGEWPVIGFESLSIGTDGRVSLPGGWIDLKDVKPLEFFGFSLGLSRIGFGTGSLMEAASDVAESLETAGEVVEVEKSGDWRWIGISGGITFVDELALGGSVDGLKIGWRVDERGVPVEWDWSLSAIGVEVVTDAFAFSGFVRFIDEPDNQGFMGRINLSITSLNLAIEAQLAIGRAEGDDGSYRYWAAILGVDLPFGFPLGSTGLALYGMQGVGLQNMVADHDPEEHWYDDWYKSLDTSGQAGVSVEKFRPEEGGLGFGLGVTLGTSPDNGFTVNAKVLLLLLFPGPTIMLIGRANVLRSRAELAGDDPMFESLLVIDGVNETVLMNVTAAYSPVNEDVLDIAATIEAFFDFQDLDAWYLEVGQIEMDRRIRASVFSLFDALAYFGIDGRGLEAGVWVGFDESWEFGPLKVALEAWFEGTGALSFDPMTISGSLAVGGSVELSAFEVSLGVSVSASLAATAFTPLRVAGEFEVALNLPWPLPDPSAKVTLEWEAPSKPDYPNPFKDVAVVHAITAESWAPATTAASAPVVPMDGRPVITFSHAVVDRDAFGQPASAISTPAPEQVGDYQVAYTLTDVSLEYEATDGTWHDVDDLYGVWLLEGDQAVDDPDEAEAAAGSRSTTKLQLWGRTPFAYEDYAVTPTLSADVMTRLTGFPCGEDVDTTATCVDWEGTPVGTTYPRTFEVADLTFDSTTVTEVARERSQATATHARALGALPGSAITVSLPGSCDSVSVHVEPTVSVTVEAFRVDPAGDVLLFSRTVTSRTAGVVAIPGSGVDYLVLTTTALDELKDTSRADAGPLASIGTSTGKPDDPATALPINWCAGVTYLYEICFRPESLLLAETDLATRREAFHSWLESWEGSARIFAPNTSYRLTVDVTASGVDADESFTSVTYFATTGPPGFYTGEDGSGALLTDLDLYVSSVSPPAGAGQTDGVPAHYRENDIVVLYGRDYVKDLYGGRLYLQVLDGNDDKVAATASDGTESTLLESDFTDASHREVTAGEEIFLEAIVGADCASFDLGSVVTSDSQGFTLPALAPQTLYRARLLGAYGSDSGMDSAGTVTESTAYELVELYRWEFVTSRFTTFAAHIGSFAEGHGTWDGDHALDATGVDSSACAAAVAADDFDALASLLGVADRPQPETLEATVIRADGVALGVLLDSPEPFDWANLDLAVTSGGAAVSLDTTIARDQRRALLLAPGMSLPAASYTLTWTADFTASPARYHEGVSAAERASFDLVIEAL
jgi:hypothetical protein